MANYKGFDSVELRKPERSVFDLSHERRTSTRMGRLTPIFICETLPNDTFRVNSEVMVRLAPLLAPIMHRIHVYVHFFFVPNRLLFKEWEKFITNGRLGTETPPVPPNFLYADVCDRGQGFLDVGSLADHLGMASVADSTSGNWGTRTFDTMPHAAAYKVWYDYYRDRNYVADNEILPLPAGSTVVDATIDELMQTRVRDWEKDYFTSSLPWTQRGDQVLMPMTIAVDTLVNKATQLPPNIAAATGGVLFKDVTGQIAYTEASVTNDAELHGDNASVTINDFRRANALQTYLERNALAGSRYPEYIWAHFNRRSSDGRLQRAEYLGGGKVTLKVSEIVTTAYSAAADATVVPPGNMAGHGISFGNTNRFTYNCEEHGFVIGYMSIMPVSGYFQGTRRMFLERNTFLDYALPAFAHLGEQPVYKYELNGEAPQVPTVRGAGVVFGYQSRFCDWKNIMSSSHGDFKSSLLFWHLDRNFDGVLELGAQFCNFEDELQDRIFAVSDVDTCWCYIYNQVTVKRSLPYFGTPRL